MHSSTTLNQIIYLSRYVEKHTHANWIIISSLGYETFTQQMWLKKIVEQLIYIHSQQLYTNGYTTLNGSFPVPRPGPVFCLFLGECPGCTRSITGQVTSVTWPLNGWTYSVTCPVIGRAQLELTPSKKEKAGLGYLSNTTRNLDPFPSESDILVLQ